MPSLSPPAETPLKLAHKITPEDRHIDWTTWPADQIIRYSNVIGPLWSNIEEAGSTEAHRCIWPSGFRSAESFWQESRSKNDVISSQVHELDCAPGTGFISPSRDFIMVKTIDRKWLVAQAVTLAGLGKSVPPGDALVKTKILPPDVWQGVRKAKEAIRISKPFV